MTEVVAVDALGVGGRRKGVPRALLNLLRELPSASPDIRYVALVDRVGAEALERAGIDIEARVESPRSGVFWEASGASRAAAVTGAGILYTMREALFGRDGIAVVAHIHEPPWYRT